MAVKGSSQAPAPGSGAAARPRDGTPGGPPGGPRYWPSCWVVTDGKAGTENQCRGLAEAMGLAPEIRRLVLRPPWRALVPHFRLGLRFAPARGGDDVRPPWPDLVIASGRQSTAAAIDIRRRSRGASFVVQIQDPGCDAGLFDRVVVPRHDRLRGPNVLVTEAALGRVTPAAAARAAAEWAPRFADLPRPRVAVLIGGPGGVYHLDPMRMGDIADQLSALCRERGAGLMVTMSRRTGADNAAILGARLADLPARIWAGEGHNPYLGMLGLADHILVTADSVSMISEAAATGTPVHILELPGGTPKFARFHDRLMDLGITRPFDGRLASWSYRPLDDTARVAGRIWTDLAARGFTPPPES